MEKKINQKVNNYIVQFKDDIYKKMQELELGNELRVNQLLQYVYDYDKLVLGKEDFQKRKRVKNFVPIYERCCAKRANDEQCTRRKKEGSEYCGTHEKGTPHGILDARMDQKMPTTQKIEVWTQDIQGIVYYVDKFNNVYDPADIIKNTMNPKIIAKYVKQGDTYTIDEL